MGYEHVRPGPAHPAFAAVHTRASVRTPGRRPASRTFDTRQHACTIG